MNDTAPSFPNLGTVGEPFGRLLGRERSVRVGGLHGAATALLLADVANTGVPLLVVTADPRTRDALRLDLETLLGRGDLKGFARRKGVLIETLKKGGDELLRHARLKRDRSGAVPEELLRELANVRLDEVPESYRALIRQYYRILSTGGGGGGK